MLLKLFPAGEQILRQQAKKVTKAKLLSAETQKIIDLMIDTMRDHPGVGLAAPQVGEPVQIIVIEDKKDYLKKVPKTILAEQGRAPTPLTVLINPRLTVIDSDQLYFFEGCMSVNGYRAVTPREKSVEVTGWDRAGNPLKIRADGWFARVLQHEIDHLNGILYTDLMLPKSLMNDRVFAKSWLDASSGKIQKRWLYDIKMM